MAAAFGPASRVVTNARVSMDMQGKVSRAVGAAALGLALMGPMPVLADGAVSDGTVFRARNSYGRKIVELGSAAAKGDFAAFENKKAINAFDLFISGANKKNGIKDKENKKAELALEAEIYTAVKSKNAGALKTAYDKFIDVADLKREFKPSEAGQTDSSGYSPTWGTSSQYIYVR